MRLGPSEFWSITDLELYEMVEAVLEEEKRQQEAEYWRTAWQTALLMNASGNYKRRITPERLLGKNFGKDSTKKEPSQKSKTDQEKELADLKKKFMGRRGNTWQR